MMVFFNDPVVVPDPAQRAIRMAVAVRDVSRPASARGWRKRGWDLGLGVGMPRAAATIGAHRLRGALGLRRHRQRHQPGRAALRRGRRRANPHLGPRSRGSWRI